MSFDGASSKELPQPFFHALGAGRLGAILSRIRRWLADGRSSWKLAGIALIVLSPTIWSGLVTDDLFQRLLVQGKFGGGATRIDLFNLISSDPVRRAASQELGTSPWWAGAHTQVSYWRPLAAITHFIDYSLWPHAAWLMHIETLAWYGGLIVACGLIYRRFIPTPWIAGLATAFYAFDHAHAFPAGWICNRNAFMSTLFGVLSLLAHDRWRSERRLSYGVLAWAWFVLVLLTAEAGLTIFGYTVAYTIFLDRGGRARVFSLAPYLGIIVVWRVVYHALGYGVVDSSLNLDPLVDKFEFWAHALRATPILLASSVFVLPADAFIIDPTLMRDGAIVAIAALAFFSYAVWPLLRRDATARFFAAGAVIAAVPMAGSFPTDRYLFWVGLGVLGVMAQLAETVFDEESDRPRESVRWGICCMCLALRGLLSPALIPLRAVVPAVIEDQYDRMMHAMPRGPNIKNQTVVIINPLADALATELPIVAMGRDQSVPAHMYTLYGGRDDIRVARTGTHSIEVRTDIGWLEGFRQRVYRNTPVRAGETVRLEGMMAEVRGVTSDERPNDVEFTFAKALDDPDLVLLSCGEEGFTRFVPPSTGTTVTLRAPQAYVPSALRPHIRSRGID